MTPTLQKHLDAIKSGSITKTNIIGLRKAFNTNERLVRGYGAGMTSPIVKVNDIAEIRRAITMHEPRVSLELRASGLKLLRDPRYRRRWNKSQAKIIGNYILDSRTGIG